MDSVGLQPFQLDDVRTRLRKLNDDELLRFGSAAAGMYSPEANFGKPAYSSGEAL